jgi:flagellar basal-body rod modification protein FlgD
MTDAINGTTQSSGAAGATSSTSAQKPLDKEAFLKLLVAQISHQDPLKPMEGTEFVTQLSQFASVEQAIAQSSRLDEMTAQIRGLSNNQATALVGKRVSIRGQAFAFDGVMAAKSSASLSGSAQKVTVSVVDSAGKVVRTMDLGARGAGPLTVTWDGKDNSGLTMPKGNYSMKVQATNASGGAVDVAQDVSGTVTRVSFDKGYPEVLLDSGATAPISDLVAVEGKTP